MGDFIIFGTIKQLLCQFLRMKLKNVTYYQTIVVLFVCFFFLSGGIGAQNYNDSLLDGSWAGNADKVQRAILNKADLNYTLLDGATALHYACGGNHLAVVKLLVSGGAAINLPDKKGRIPLHVVAENGNDSIGEFLIVNGALLYAKNSEGYTPLMVAVSRGYFVFSDLCLFYGSDVNIRPDDSSSVCHLCVHNGNPYVLQLLIENGADINLCDADGKTPLAWAVLYNDTACTGILLNAGATLQTACSDLSVNTLLSDAILKGCDATLPYLLKNPSVRGKTDLRRLRDDVIRIDHRQMRLAFRNDSIPLSWRPVFQGMLFKPELFVNFRDHFTGFSMGTMEMKSKIGLEMGVATRLWKKRVLFDYEPTGELLQLQEKRGFVYFGQYKAIRVLQKSFSGLQLEPGIQQTYSWAYFDGMSTRPWRGWTVSPAFDVVWFGRNWNVSLGARFYDFNNSLSSFYFSLSGGWVIPFKNR